MNFVKEKVVEVQDSAGHRLAIILRDAGPRSTAFYTQEQEFIQVGSFTHKAGTEIQAHTHNDVPRVVHKTQEVLIIRSGELSCSVFDENKRLCWSGVLGAGDVLVLLNGWHGFSVLEDCEFLEVKNGPYIGEADKTRVDL